MNEKPVIIIGNGGHATVLVDTIQLQGRKIIGFVAPTNEENQFGIPYLGNDDDISDYRPEEIELVNGIGSVSNMQFRKKIYDHFKSRNYIFSKVVHPSAIVSNSVILGEGTQIMAGAVIQPLVKIADNTIVNTSVSIDHNCQIGKHCHIAPGTTLSGNVTIGDNTHIGTGSTIIQSVEVGSNVLIGAASLVIENIKNGIKAYGVPTKEV